MSLSKNITFTSATFDRQALNRTDELWLSDQLNNDGSLFLLYWENKFLTSDGLNISFLNRLAAEKFNQSTIDWKYMGVLDNHQDNRATVFATELNDPSDLAIDANWQSLRAIGLQVSVQEANLLAYTQGLLNWHAINNFCSDCGTAVDQKHAGHALLCSNDECSKEVFPRTDPAVIVLIHNEDACLLGRGASWPEGMYSCLAGFVETGEDLESAVRREVFEESGLLLGRIDYHASQPWPFPQSLMLGFHAEATNRELTFHDGEIQDARWFSRNQLLDAVANNELRLSASLSISYHLIEAWFNQQSEIPLDEHLGR